jgi:hypothetical protein
MHAMICNSWVFINNEGGKKMSLKKKLIVAAAGAALTAGMVVPAMALENEFHGSLAIRGFNSNYLAGTAGRLNIDGDTATTRNWVEQRARIFYTAKANDNLKLVTGFELDSVWGNSSYTTGRNTGGALGSDTTNIETKWVYLYFNEPNTGANFKVGIQGLNDAYKGIVVGVGADAAGLLASKTFGPVTGTLGWFRLDDRNTGTATAGKQTRDLLLLDAKYALSKDIKLGGSYYFLNNDNVASTGSVPLGALNDYNVHILGASAAANIGPASIDGFAVYEFGVAGTSHVNAFAGNLAGKIKVGPGAVKLSALYVSGNNSTSFGSNSFISVNNTTSAVFSENGVGALGNMFILCRNPKETTNEQAIIAESSNQNQGIIGGAVGYDVVMGKAFGGANVGMASTAKKVSGRDSKYMGTEINAEVGYKLFDNLTATVRAAYVVLGDYYKDKGTPANTEPANPYVGQIVLAYVF